jgi:hypothetical protein
MYAHCLALVVPPEINTVFDKMGILLHVHEQHVKNSEIKIAKSGGGHHMFRTLARE